MLTTKNTQLAPVTWQAAAAILYGDAVSCAGRVGEFLVYPQNVDTHMNASSVVQDLDRRLGIPGVASVCEGNGGLPRVRIRCSGAEGEMYLHGAHVTSWRPANDELLFTSTQSRWQDGQPIRGGIPICFPWFRAKLDDPQAPPHGLVRTRTWQLESIMHSQGAVTVSMSIESDELTGRWWPAEFRLVHRVTFGSELRLELACTNTGMMPLRFEEALHTYNRVADVATVCLQGLDGINFLDNTDANKEKTQRGDVKIACRIDNAFLDTRNSVDLIDPIFRRRIRLQKQNSLTTVVWNPWSEGAAGLQDLGHGEWRQFVCIEASNILQAAVTLASGQEHKISAILTVAKT